MDRADLVTVVLADPAPEQQMIAPPQYSVAWVILAVLCALVINALIVATLRITRGIEKKVAYRGRPSDLEALRAEILRSVNDIADRLEAGANGSRDGHPELTGGMGRFRRRRTGHDVASQDLSTLLADQRTRAVGELIEDLYEPDIALSSDRQLSGSVRRAREVIRQWS